MELPGLRRVEHVMGMPVIVDVRDEGAGPEPLDEVFAWLRWVDAVFSTYDPESEISRLGRGDLALADAHREVRAVLGRCEELREATDGFFDARAGGGLDPSGLVKGWSVDRAAGILDGWGLRSFAIDAGGDMRLRGRAAPAWCWRVGIQHPLEPQAVARVIETTELAVATSGEYARGHHVLDPHTAAPPRGILSVTVSGPDLATADAYATAAFAMGAPRVLHWTARLHGDYQALTILADGDVYATPGFPAAAPVAA
jgi:thiamine biosynthesis lipoprotein